MSWKHLDADVQAWSNQLTSRAFMADIVEPALALLETKIDTLSRSDDAGDAFRCADTREIQRATAMAFCLSIQSIWERQIRSYLTACIRQTTGDAAKIAKTNEGKWEDIFLGVRGIGPATFKCYPELQTMQKLANVCRHGDGRSANDLWKSNKEFWPVEPSLPPFPGMPAIFRDPDVAPRSELTVIPLARLRAFSEAIFDFWEEVRYLSLGSIIDKHPTLIAELEAMRQARQ